ncbi:hypothetical protein [Pseudomonas tremae]|uniref:hypothetical protein n=1 Tax=Pseudomonas tremae TaxID=200454 RepID=UPI001F31D7CC|nr:hypothetical protein [Pseudomonas tremae]MCF5806348.1 hypothetical protein [Pseudomonas tremae]MCF5811505.1 hypothetical protein [Pseudomonas tremae]
MDSSLPVVQLKESHALALDTTDKPLGGSYTLVVAPSARTSPGDKVKVAWQGFSSDGFRDELFSDEHIVTASDRVLSWVLDPTHVSFIEGGTAQMSYRVEYSDDPGEFFDSDIQTIDIKPTSAPRLTAFSIDNNTGGPVDPVDYPQGMNLNVDVYPDIQVGDCVLCYIQGGPGEPQVIDYLLIDQSIIDKGTFQFTVEQPWLEKNINERAVFEYQYARYGKAESSYALNIEIKEAYLSMPPIIEGAEPGAPGPPVRSHKKVPSQGYISAMSLRAGARVRIPPSEELMDGDTVEVQWQGFGTSGQYVTSVSEPEDERLFLIPASAVPANMGKHVNVLYRINRPGKTLITSEVFILLITPLPTHNYTTVQCSCTDIGRLLLNCVPESGAVVTLRKWVFMAPGQRVTIEANSGTSEWPLSDFPITQTHIDQGQITATLSKSFLTQLGVGARLILNVSVSFDDGNSFTRFPAVSLVLAIKQPGDNDVESDVCVQPHAVDYATTGMSKKQMIEWMQVKPRTMGWGAILAFNQKDTNTVLLQEYISRFSTGDYLDPIEKYIATTATTGQFITGYQMDCPRLSFETANIDRETADAKLTMNVVGGTQVTFNHIPGGKEPTRIGIIDPLNGPVLTMDLELVDVPGSIDSAGKVVLDLSKSSNFSLSFSDFILEQEVGGLFFQEYFESLPDSKRVVTISEITKHSDDVIKPETFKLRTQAAPGSKERNAGNYGDGSVLALVAMENEKSGGNPGADFPYLIPNDTQNSAILLISNKLLLEATIGEAMVMVGLIDPGAWTIEPESAESFKIIHPQAPHFHTFISFFDHGQFNCKTETTYNTSDAGADRSAVGRIQNGKIHLGLNISSPKGVNTAIGAEGWPASKHAYNDVKTDISKSCGYEVDRASHMITPTGLTSMSSAVSFPIHKPPPVNDGDAQQAFRKVESQFVSTLKSMYEDDLDWILKKLPDINIFALQSILFKSGDSIAFDEVALPGDMAVFGHLGPTVTHFSISPLEAVVGLGDTLPFTTTPSTSGVAWTVKRIAGETGFPGGVTKDGVYEAPPSLGGAPFIRVKVTATVGSYSSSALVSVVVSDITVNPVIQTCGAHQKRSLSAGSRGADTLTWTLKTPSNGGHLLNEVGFENTYTAPTPAADVPYFVEEVVVETKAGKKKSSYLVVLNAPSALNIMRDFSYSSVERTKLIVKAGVTLLKPEEITWEIILGSGSIDNGVYTPPSPLEHNFVLIVVRHTMFTSLIGSILIPLPLFDYPEDTAPLTPEFMPAYRPI